MRLLVRYWLVTTIGKGTSPAWCAMLCVFGTLLPTCTALQSGSATDKAVTTLAALSCGKAPTCGERPDSVGVRVRGRLMVEGPSGMQPLPFVRLVLTRPGGTAAHASSDRQGTFMFSRKLAHASYELAVDSDRYEARTQVDLGLTTPEIVLVAKPRAPTAP